MPTRQSNRRSAGALAVLSPVSPSWPACFSASTEDEPERQTGRRKGAADKVHLPVMVDEIVDFLQPGPGQLILDGTVGLGGHTERFLRAGARVVGLDQDAEALALAGRRFAEDRDRLELLHGNAANVEALLRERTRYVAPCFDAVIYDLGVSSFQLDSADRGFSFREEGPLDMRMDPGNPTTAGEIVNSWDEGEIEQVLREFGEERRSRFIAREIVRRRERKPFDKTTELAELIRSLIPGRSGRIDVATRSFQALRIAVNRELEVLPDMLEAAIRVLKPGGKLTVLAFHSLEDRIVKRFLRERSRRELDDPSWPAPRPNPAYILQLPTAKALKPSRQEAARNPRARSARLRLAQKRI